MQNLVTNFVFLRLLDIFTENIFNLVNSDDNFLGSITMFPGMIRGFLSNSQAIIYAGI